MHSHRSVGELPREQVGFRERVTLRVEERQNGGQFVSWKEPKKEQTFYILLFSFLLDVYALMFSLELDSLSNTFMLLNLICPLVKHFIQNIAIYYIEIIKSADIQLCETDTA